jgi:hypothetical protein
MFGPWWIILYRAEGGLLYGNAHYEGGAAKRGGRSFIWTYALCDGPDRRVGEIAIAERTGAQRLTLKPKAKVPKALHRHVNTTVLDFLRGYVCDAQRPKKSWLSRKLAKKW